MGKACSRIDAVFIAIGFTGASRFLSDVSRNLNIPVAIPQTSAITTVSPARVKDPSHTEVLLLEALLAVFVLGRSSLMLRLQNLFGVDVVRGSSGNELE